MLYLVSTPIGNLSDMTFRAVDTLKSCNYILCEDTRHSLPLMKHFQISTPLKSYHKFNESKSIPLIVSDLQNGMHIALISDAGTPLISDPGLKLVQACQQEKLPFTAIPGACAAIQALVLSGLESTPFQFIGFLPKQQKALTQTLQLTLQYQGTTICYESPHRIEETLSLLESLAPHRHCVLARELTKKFEEAKKGTVQEIAQWIRSYPPKGEIVLLIGPDDRDSSLEWTSLSPVEHVEMMQKTYSLSKQEAIKLVAQLRNLPKREIYNLFHQNK